MIRRADFLGTSHSIRNVAYVLCLHASLIVWFIVARSHLSLATYILVTPFVCLIHQRILSEWYHEATHYNLVNQKRLNDPLADLLMSFFLGPSIAANRARHFRHHAAQVYFVDDDPETALYTASSRSDLVRGFARDLTGLTALRAFRDVVGSGSKRKETSGYVAYWFFVLLAGHGILFAATILLGAPEVYFFYYGTLLTLYTALNRLRTYGQHAIVVEEGAVAVASPVSRTIFGNAIEWIVLNTAVMKYHHEHHAFPNLPYRALAGLAAENNDRTINTHAESILNVIGPVSTPYSREITVPAKPLP